VPSKPQLIADRFSLELIGSFPEFYLDKKPGFHPLIVIGEWDTNPVAR
jgi:hypothetical protein